MVPSLDWFIYAFVRKEAVLSSQIEGTQATLVDLLTFEAQEGAEQTVAPNADVEEVCNYLDALAYSRAQLADPNGLPLSMRLLSETHHRLMRGVRGGEKLPGEVRRSQNWIGGSRPGNAAYVPPPPHALGEALGAFEKYLHADDSLPPLVRAGLLHVQFETIAPVPRWQRPHWTLAGDAAARALEAADQAAPLPEPLLQAAPRGLLPSPQRGAGRGRLGGLARLFPRRGCDDRLRSGRLRTGAVRARGRGLHASARPGGNVRRRAEALRDAAAPPSCHRRIRDEIRGDDQADRGTGDQLLVAAGVLAETTGKKRDRSFVYRGYLDRLRVGTELDDVQRTKT